MTMFQIAVELEAREQVKESLERQRYALVALTKKMEGRAGAVKAQYAQTTLDRIRNEYRGTARVE